MQRILTSRLSLPMAIIRLKWYPTAFNSQFKLESFVGRRTVESSHPQGIHRRPGSWGVTSGYYGDDKDTKNTVTLKASSGNLKLNYA
ncbi:hypothetical protein G6F42_025122 [Rhizopus arrhizus]|nr:hypothetical protein G6F42_025122 [Rhizopus arrhizus]